MTRFGVDESLAMRRLTFLSIGITLKILIKLSNNSVDPDSFPKTLPRAAKIPATKAKCNLPPNILSRRKKKVFPLFQC
jgi:hypothetical protein